MSTVATPVVIVSQARNQRRQQMIRNKLSSLVTDWSLIGRVFDENRMHKLAGIVDSSDLGRDLVADHNMEWIYMDDVFNRPFTSRIVSHCVAMEQTLMNVTEIDNLLHQKAGNEVYRIDDELQVMFVLC